MSGRAAYEVFLSFRGPDTRNNFADFLYTMLNDVGICVFRDEEELERGQEISSQLISEIQKAKISIPVISREYASSRSCLMELKEMVKCMDNNKQTIIPIFYHVSPADVRNGTGPFERALDEHQQRALRRIGDLKGHHLHEQSDKYHGKVIKEIVRQVELMLKKRDLIVPKQLVGVDPHVQEIMAKLKFDYRNGQAVKIGDTRKKVLIYGIPGVGKTLLAKCVYNRLHHLHDACSFLEKTQEEIKHQGIVSVQNRLISHLHKGNASKFDCSDYALGHIQRRFLTMKVLILLDDVKDQEQLSALVGELDWYGPGSTVIVTSQRGDVLKKIKGAESFGLRTMQQDKALQLFSRHAFEKDSPPEEFKELSKQIVAATDWLPLALEKVGASLLSTKNKKVWTETLTALKEAPHKSVQEAFFESHTTLDENEQKIFLDMACFFNGKDKRIPCYMWDDCKYFPSRSILSLHAMSLVEIGEDKEIRMRGILKIFGREIVKRENKNEPCKRSRLCNPKEALDVLSGGKGTKKVEALRLEFGDVTKGNICFRCDNFEGLQNLRFLKLDQADIRGNFGDHFSSLRWLDWQGCPEIFEDHLELNLQKLVILDLSGSRVHKDWSGWELLTEARKLKVLKLTGCLQLNATPKFPASMELERLILEGCSNLAVIDPSFGNLEKLVSLNMKGCSLLRELPDLGPMRGLKELVIDGTSISRINVQAYSMTKLKLLSARNCKNLIEISDSIRYLNSLAYLSLDGSEIHTLPRSIGSLEKLNKLSLEYCERLSNLPDEIGNLRSLQFLDLSGSGISTLPESIESLEKLNRLYLKNCKRLSDLPDGIGDLRSLQFLNLSYSEISTLPGSIGSLEELNKLDLNNCKRLSDLPDEIGKLTSLQFMDLSDTLIVELPPSVKDLKVMKVLRMKGTRIREFPEAILNLEKLEEIDFSSCRSLEGRIPDDISSRLTSLATLNLSHTRISGLPASIPHLSRFWNLNVSGCHNLLNLPESSSSLINVIQDSGK